MKASLFAVGCIIAALPLPVIAQQRAPNDFIVEADSTASESHAKVINHQLLQQLPFRGASQDYYGLFSGTVQQDFRGTEYLHVRGSRHDEIAYAFEGADVRSAFTGLNLIRFIPEALESLSLQTSPTASDHHAGAQLQHRLRRGGQNFKFTVRGETDRFTPDYQSRFDTYSYGYYDYLLTAEGKIFKDNVRFFAAGERESFDDHYRKFWKGFRIDGRDFSLVDRFTGESLQEALGTDEIVVRPGNIPNAASDRFTLNSVVAADYAPLTLRAVALYNREKQQRNDTPIWYLFNPARIPESKQTAGLLSLQADYTGPKDLSAHLQLDFLRANDKIYDPLFEDDFLLYRDSLAIVAKGMPWDSPSNQSGDSYILGPGDFLPYYFHFSRPGDLLASYGKSEENYWSISGAAKKQLGRYELIAGGSLQRRTLRYFELGSSLNFMSTFREFGLAPNQLNVQQLLEIRNRGQVQVFGYDIFGNKIEDTGEVHDAPRHPSAYSFYLEDRYRTKDLLVSAGLRYDSFASDALVFSDPTDPGFSHLDGNISPSTLRTAASHHYFSPRFSAAFSANERLSLQFHFGKYVQQVQLRDVYASRAYWNRVLGGGFLINDPRGPNAEPVRATQTVLSVSYQAQPKLHAQASLFYKLTEGHLEGDRIETRPEAAGAEYNILVNSGEATAKGIELSLRYNHQGLGAWMSYALSDVRGFTSYPISNLRDVELEIQDGFHSKTQPPSPLDFNQKHRGHALVAYEFGRRAPIWLRQTGLHLLFHFNSGHHFTLYEGAFG